ncbi:hypothetical protein Tco_1294392 [Tanacetum coccineum]
MPEIVTLKARLETDEKESAELSGLRGRASELETEVVAKSKEVAGLNKQNAELLGKVSALESVREELSNQVSKLGVDCESLRGEIAGEAKLRDEFASLQDAMARHFEEQSAQLDGGIADVRRDMDTYLYHHMLTAIAGRRWVLGHGVRLAVIKCAQSFECHFALGKVPSLSINNGIQQGLEVEIEHGKAGRSLAQELEALKDSPLAPIMFALTLDGDVDSTPRLHELQPSLDQITVPVYSQSSGSRRASSISHEMLLSDAIPAIHERAERRGLVPSSSFAEGGVAHVVPIQDSSLGVAGYQVSSLVHTGDTESSIGRSTGCSLVRGI